MLRKRRVSGLARGHVTQGLVVGMVLSFIEAEGKSGRSGPKETLNAKYSVQP